MGTYKGFVKFNVNPGEYYAPSIKIYEQQGAVIKGTVLFENNQPAIGATAILSYINCCGNTITPISFTFTDENGSFIFKVEDTSLNYTVDITYNDCIMKKICY